MGFLDKRQVVSVWIGLAAVVAATVVVLSGAIAGAHAARQVKSVALLALPRGSFEISLGDAPSWLPLSGTSQTLTLLGGPPKKATSDNAYVGFTQATKRCAETPRAARGTVYELSDFYAKSHSAAVNAGAFAPNGGAARSTYIDSVSGVRFSQGPKLRACIWLASSAAAAKRSGHTLAASLLIPVLNNTFAASVSNLTGAVAGKGGYAMFAFDGGHPFRYSVHTLQCAKTGNDGATGVGAGTPASETVSISASPCSGDGSTFSFSGGNTQGATLAYTVADALAAPPTTLTSGACELDPLTSVSVDVAETYLAAVGCKLGELQVSPYSKSLPRGDVSWVSVDGGVADIAPAGSTVDLVVNG